LTDPVLFINYVSPKLVYFVVFSSVPCKVQSVRGRALLRLIAGL